MRDAAFTPLLRVRAQPLDYGDYGDPAKMTDSIFDFVSRASVLGWLLRFGCVREL